MSTAPSPPSNPRIRPKDHPVFDGLGAGLVRRIIDGATPVSVEAGTVIVRRGDAGDALYLLIEGIAEVPVVGPDGETRFTARLQAGDVFGEMALLTDEPRSADVVAETAVRCLRIDRDGFARLMRVEPSVAGLLTTLLGARLVQADGIHMVGKYRILAPLGEGGMGRVYRGVHTSLGRTVAVKMLDHSLVHRGDFAERFREEGRIIGALRHPNIVAVHDVEEAWGTMFIIMEQVHGPPLDEIAAGGPLDASTVLGIATDIAAALQSAHAEGIVHRDVKPGNIIVSADRACLTDFGVAVSSCASLNSRESGQFFGTAAYASPEQAMGQPVDARSDIYSLGIVLWQLLAGRPPFDGASVDEVLRRHIHEDVPPIQWIEPSVPSDLATLVDRACAREPDRRWSSCAEMLDHLDRAARRTEAPGQVRVRTITLVYSPDVEADVDRLVKSVERMAAPIDGLRVK